MVLRRIPDTPREASGTKSASDSDALCGDSERDFSRRVPFGTSGDHRPGPIPALDGATSICGPDPSLKNGRWYSVEITAEVASGPRPASEADERGDDGGGDNILRLPSLRAVVRHALPALLESTIVPGALFYVVLLLDGFHGALIAALTWSLLALGRRLVRGQKVPAVLVLSVVLVSARTVVAYVTGSAFSVLRPTHGQHLPGGGAVPRHRRGAPSHHREVGA